MAPTYSQERAGQAGIDLLSKQAANAKQFVVFDACRNELHLSGSD